MNDMKSLIAAGDLKVVSGMNFNATTFEVAPTTKAGRAWFDENVSKFANSINVLKSALV
nr:hypothetical protein [uncultured Mediterranean phage uvMED]|tara:strand:+ start:664 stop:840 length:177 start_codon:yes stop_codon:yes gene_type:complete